QLTLWYTLVSAVLIVIFGVAFYTSSDQLLAKSFDTTLQLRAQQVAEGITVRDGKMTIDDVVNELPELDANSAIIDTAGSDDTSPGPYSANDKSTISDLNVPYPDRSIMVRIFDAHGKLIYSTATFNKIPVPVESIQQ